MTKIEARKAVIGLLTLVIDMDMDKVHEIVEDYDREDLETVLYAALSFSVAVMIVPGATAEGPTRLLGAMGLRMATRELNEER